MIFTQKSRPDDYDCRRGVRTMGGEVFSEVCRGIYICHTPDTARLLCRNGLRLRPLQRIVQYFRCRSIACRLHMVEERRSRLRKETARPSTTRNRFQCRKPCVAASRIANAWSSVTTPTTEGASLPVRVPGGIPAASSWHRAIRLKDSFSMPRRPCRGLIPWRPVCPRSRPCLGRRDDLSVAVTEKNIAGDSAIDYQDQSFPVVWVVPDILVTGYRCHRPALSIHIR
jgi:hypothetical protein